MHRIKTRIPLPIILFVPLFFQTKLDNIEPGISNNHEIVYSIECVKVFYSGKLAQSIEIYIYIYIKVVGEMNPGTHAAGFNPSVYMHAQLRTPWLVIHVSWLLCAMFSRRDRSNDQ